MSDSLVPTKEHILKHFQASYYYLQSCGRAAASSSMNQVQQN